LCYFFFQAEDGIRDRTVTGVQTCALPISMEDYYLDLGERLADHRQENPFACEAEIVVLHRRHADDGREIGRPLAPRDAREMEDRSEERRVGKECRARRAQDHYKENNVEI